MFYVLFDAVIVIYFSNLLNFVYAVYNDEISLEFSLLSLVLFSLWPDDVDNNFIVACKLSFSFRRVLYALVTSKIK